DLFPHRRRRGGADGGRRREGRRAADGRGGGVRRDGPRDGRVVEGKGLAEGGRVEHGQDRGGHGRKEDPRVDPALSRFGPDLGGRGVRGGRGPGRDHGHGPRQRPNGRGDGGAHRRRRRRPHGLRHVQSGRQEHDHRRDQAYREDEGAGPVV
ncbi:MAG: Cyclic pyranopterin monophosphate synthase accessory protein, partial [uncultured Rubrobacteraceae bacterium]